MNRVDREHGFCAGENCLARVTEVEASSLVLDIVDARTNRLVWRGWAQRDLEGMLGRRNAMRRVIDTAVAGMLASLPDAR